MITLFLANVWGYVMAHWKIFATVGAFLLLLVIIIGFRSCGSSEPVLDEKEIQERQQEIEKREAEKLANTIQKSNEVLANVANRDKQAEANTQEAVNKNFTNTNMTEAQKARCKAYPSSAGCPKL